jgi:AraC-like DNA-binding protein
MSSSSISTFSDPYHYQAAIRGIQVEMFPTATGTFHAELTRIDLNRLWMQRIKEHLPRIAHGPVSSDRAAIEFPYGSGQPAARFRGVDVSPGAIVVHDTEPVHRRSFAASQYGSMSLTPKDLAAASRAILGRELFRPSTMRVIHPEPALVARLWSLHEDARRFAEVAPDSFSHPAVARSLEQELLHVMMRCLSEGEPVPDRAAARHHSAIMARFDGFLAANRYEPLYLAEICAAIGASERTLRLCCEEYLGLGPVRYLWLRRMHLARRALIQADSAGVSVTSVATDHGFWELGRFSVEYRKLFGESPSTTLRRSRLQGPMRIGLVARFQRA